MAITFKNNINKITDKINEVGNTKEVNLSELITHDFIEQYTKFNDLQDMFDSFKPNMDEMELEIVTNTVQWDEHIESHSDFDSWNDLMQSAYVLWFKNKTGL